MNRVLISGGSRGIGAELVRTFRAEGYNVAFTYKNSAASADQLAEESGALAIKADSASEADILRAVNITVDTYGAIDILINNAAVSSFSLLSDLTTDEWNDTLAVNLTAPFIFSRESSKYMIRAKWGRIINISSMWGVVGSSCESHYSASKAGLIGLTKALAKELGPSGITVNAIAPGLIDTEMNSALSEADIDAIVDDTPISRIGRVEDVARAALYLASDDASFVTGDVLNISGGYTVW